MKPQIAKIPPSKDNSRIVIVGAGFGGLKVARSLAGKDKFQVVLLDKNNYHQFQPLFYQVATSGLEPASISFPLRKAFQKKNNVHFRVAEALSVDTENKSLESTIGTIEYDELILSYGATTNYFGNKNIEKYSMPMKSTIDSIEIRNCILTNYEKALSQTTAEEESALMNIVIVGGGPTGVELAGAISEMRKYVLPKDYPELDFGKMQIHLLEGGDRLLNGMSDKAANGALGYLQGLNVLVKMNSFVTDFDGRTVHINDGTQLITKTVLWAAGINIPKMPGIPDDCIGKGGRLSVNEFNEINGLKHIWAIGDTAIMKSEKYPAGHPQVAQPAIQQGKNLSLNLLRMSKSKQPKPFKYLDKGSLATIGRNRAVADLPYGRFKGFLAWILWLVVHIMYIVGVKNRLFVLLNWTWSYLTYDQSLRLVIRRGKQERELPVAKVESPIV